MSVKQLASGYTLTRVEGQHIVNGIPVRHIRSDRAKTIIVTDNGNPDDLMVRTAEAVEDSYRAAAQAAQRENGRSWIEVLHGITFPKAPLIPETEDPRLPFRPPSDR